MGTYTYRDLIRIYSDGVMKGTSDPDLSKKARRHTAIALNLASNHNCAARDYPPSPDEREAVVKALHDLTWQASAFFTGADSTAFGIATQRATEILRNI